jgi:hypothetical protein
MGQHCERRLHHVGGDPMLRETAGEPIEALQGVAVLTAGSASVM